MKALVITVSLLAVLGIVYGLAFVGIIPVRQIAKKSKPAEAILTAMKLYHPAPSKSASHPPAQLAQAPDPLASDRAALQAEREQLAIEKIQLDKKLTAGPPASASPASVPTSSKMSAIYDTMKPSEIAQIFAKLPNPPVCDALMNMDEMKAGKVLAAMPPDRAAKLTTLLNQTMASNPQTDQQAQSLPATSVP